MNLYLEPSCDGGVVGGGGGHPIFNAPGYVRGIYPHEVGCLPPDAANSWAAIIRGHPVDRCAGSPCGHTDCGWSTSQLGNLWLCCGATILFRNYTFFSGLGAPPPHWEAGVAPHRGSGDYHTPSPFHNTHFWRFMSVVTVPKQVCGGILFGGFWCPRCGS